MKKRYATSPVLALVLVFGGLLAPQGCTPNRTPGAAAAQVPSPAETRLNGVSLLAAPSSSSYACGLLTVPIGSSVPGDAPALPNQLTADCFAWWEFISLNWSTDGSAFGTPGNPSPVAWETYTSLGQLFLPGGAKPPPFGTQPTPPPNCGAAMSPRVHGEPLRVLTDASQFSADFINGVDDAQAFPEDSPAWLGAQNGTHVWYEVRVNQDEYNKIAENKWYSAEGQAASIAAGVPILLPQGSYQGATGAIELKAAWVEVPDPSNEKWRRYKISQAIVVDPNGPCREVTVALVGLHIIHKTASQPTWLWATFEHVDNAPDQKQVDDGDVPADKEYNFYSAACQAQQVAVNNPQCLPQGVSSPVTVDCTPNTSPPYYIGEGCPGPVPQQVTRTLPIDTNAQQANSLSQQALDDYAHGNVFVNYQLVNVIWSTNPVQDPAAPIHVPTPTRALNPPTKVANTTLETYAQHMTCTDCHQNATTATASGQPPSTFSADFSFALSAAQ